MQTNYTEIGRKRLGIVLKMSMQYQGLSAWTAEQLIEQLFKTKTTKDTITQISNGYTKAPKPDTLGRIAPLIFRVSHFQLLNNDPIGKPIFVYNGASYKASDKFVKLMACYDVKRLPDFEFRYHSWTDLQTILEERSQIMRSFPEPARR